MQEIKEVPRNDGIYKLINFTRRLFNKKQIMTTVISHTFDKPIVLEPGESKNFRITIPLKREDDNGE